MGGGHASLDREFDGRADADTSISLPLVEEALVRLVNAHQVLADLISESPLLQALAAASSSGSEGDAAVIPFRVEWGVVTSLAMLAQESASRAADALLGQLQSPPGYGTAEDTDWRVGSEHHVRRVPVDEVAAQAVRADG